MNYIKVLGASGSKSKNLGTTSFQISKEIVVDAGNIINTLGDNSQYINHIFLTHSHSDHITDLPFLIDGFFENRKETLIIYGSNETINTLRKHTFNNEIWPDFSNINLINSDKKAIIFKEIKINDEINKLNQQKFQQDKENIKIILEGIYIRDEFMASDDIETVERKKMEVSEFLKTIK